MEPELVRRCRSEFQALHTRHSPDTPLRLSAQLPTGVYVWQYIQHVGAAQINKPRRPRLAPESKPPSDIPEAPQTAHLS
jgi:hypothetical protein